MSDLYERDYYAWAMEQAALLRSGRLGDADIANIAEEIESLGKSEKRELVSRLQVILLHLLKWEYQPSRRGQSWRLTILVQRNDLASHMEDNPSLMSILPEVLARAYRSASLSATGETGLSGTAFPSGCPYTFEQIMDPEFWPEA